MNDLLKNPERRHRFLSVREVAQLKTRQSSSIFFLLTLTRDVSRSIASSASRTQFTPGKKRTLGPYDLLESFLSFFSSLCASLCLCSIPSSLLLSRFSLLQVYPGNERNENYLACSAGPGSIRFSQSSHVIPRKPRTPEKSIELCSNSGARAGPKLLHRYRWLTTRGVFCYLNFLQGLLCLSILLLFFR